MTHEVRFAADKLLDYLPDSQTLPQIWKEALLLNNLVLKRKLKCFCENETIKRIPVIYPIFPSTGETAKGLYSSLPFAYISWLVPSKAIPYIEVIEIPMLKTEMVFIEDEKEKIDRALSPHGIAVIGSYIKVTDSNLNKELPQIRKRVLSKIHEFSSNSMHLYLSIFSDLPKSLVEERDSRYLEAIEELENEISWEFQSQRIIPIKYQKKILVFTLNCWVLTKKDLKI